MEFPFIQKLIQSGCECYLYGGAVRDSIIGREPVDYDFAVKGFSLEALIIACSEFGTAHTHKYMSGSLRLETKDFGIVDICLMKGINENREIVSMPNGSISQHLTCMDFTMNCLARDVATQKLFDICDSLKAIKDRMIILNPSYQNSIELSPIVIIRAARFMSTLGFRLDSNTYDVFNTHKELMFEKIPLKRINFDMWRLFSSPNNHVGIELLQRLGIYKRLKENYIIPS